MPSFEETLLVFTDLDGTLLDFHTLDWQPAAPWLEKLMDEQVPVILCSSKTASEMDDIQQELGLGGLPYIAENGAVIQPDVRWENAARFISEKKHDDIRQCIARVRQEMHLKFTTFDDVDERVVAGWTGLSRRGERLQPGGRQPKNNDPARVYHTQHTGPTGWCEGLDYFLT